MNQLKSIKKSSIQPQPTNIATAPHKILVPPKKSGLISEKYKSVRSSTNSFNRATNLANYLLGNRNLTPNRTGGL